AAPAMADTFVSVAPIAVNERDRGAPSPDLVQQLVISCLSQADGVAVVERADLNAVMDEKSASVTGFVHGKRLAPRMYGVNYVITGSAAVIGGDWLLTLQANDPATSQIVASRSAMVNPRQLADQLCGKVGAPLADEIARRPHGNEHEHVV